MCYNVVNSKLVRVSQALNSASKLDLTHLKVLPNFITVGEEARILQEVDKRLRRLKYERDHWDNAIVGYRAVLCIVINSEWWPFTDHVFRSQRGGALEISGMLIFLKT